MEEVLGRLSGSHCPPVFFRADDIGAGGRAFEALCKLFRYHGVPLGMAVVPAWLSATRTEQLFQSSPLEEPLWGWHQHGWRHVNWQRTGKKSEFGEQRPLEKQWRDIWQGQQKMQEIFGERSLSIFSPPWNRISLPTVKILQQLGFKGICMEGPLPRGFRPPLTLRNMRIHVDLHTRKNKDAVSDYTALLSEIGILLGKREPIGMMIHHQRMTIYSFEFLHELICFLKDRLGVRFLSLNDLIQE
jgi:peptidoglycan/xylan/chitin deacetylase (PgdA/CDA1 family)